MKQTERINLSETIKFVIFPLQQVFKVFQIFTWTKLIESLCGLLKISVKKALLII